MRSISIEESLKNPKVLVDPEKGYILFQGRSIVPNPVEFYNPIIEWIEEYRDSNPFALNIDFKLDYFNTASHKMILQFFLILKDAKDKGATIKVSWYHYDYDEDMVEIGQEVQLLTGLDFEYIEMESE